MRPVTPLIGCFGAGLALGAAAWLAGGSSLAKSPVDRIKTGSSVNSRATGRAAGPTIGAPLFTSSPDPAVKLSGVSKTPGREAALLEIGRAAPQWIVKGRSMAGVTVVDVRAGLVVVETAGGRRVVALGETSVAVAPQIGVPGQPASDAAPFGFRMPPAPADAPRATDGR